MDVFQYWGERHVEDFLLKSLFGPVFPLLKLLAVP